MLTKVMFNVLYNVRVGAPRSSEAHLRLSICSQVMRFFVAVQAGHDTRSDVARVRLIEIVFNTMSTQCPTAARNGPRLLKRASGPSHNRRDIYCCTLFSPSPFLFPAQVNGQTPYSVPTEYVQLIANVARASPLCSDVCSKIKDQPIVE